MLWSVHVKKGQGSRMERLALLQLRPSLESFCQLKYRNGDVLGQKATSGVKIWD